ncbi:MAG: N-acetyltransferase [Spirochaetales bacterium]|nr:N-acetyltransferase [Spirochaetales bacterium]
MEFIIRKAKIDDVNRIHDLTNSMASEGLMLPRSKYKIISMLLNFYVVADENDYVVGAAALTPLWTDMAEIMSLSLDKDYHKQGLGRKLVEYIIQEARAIHFPKLIALTYQVEFFKKMGFTITDKDQFPRKLWRECLECPKLERCDETAMYLDL